MNWKILPILVFFTPLARYLTFKQLVLLILQNPPLLVLHFITDFAFGPENGYGKSNIRGCSYMNQCCFCICCCKPCRFDEGSMLGHHTARVPVKRVIPVILKIIELYKENKQSDDTLAKWIDRVVSGNESSKITGVDDIKKAIAPLIVPPNVEDEPDFYMDYGSDTNYHTVTGKGECAA